MSMAMTKKELAELVEYSYRGLHEIDKKLPEGEKLFVEAENGYDLATFIQRWVNYNLEQQRKEIDPEGQTLSDVKIIHERVKTEKTRLEVGKLQRTLVEVRAVRRLWAEIANTVMQNMLRLPGAIATMVAGMREASDIADVIEKEVRIILSDIADTPLPDETGGEDGGGDE